jgi:hypothetical protein
MGDLTRNLSYQFLISEFREGGKKIETVKPTPQHDKIILCFFVVVLDFVPDFWENTTVLRHLCWHQNDLLMIC